MSEDENLAQGGQTADAGGGESAGEVIASEAEAGVEPAGEATEDEAGQASPKKKREPMDVSRRNVCIGVGGTVALLGLGALKYVAHNPLVRPPGGQDESHLVSACIRCERCYEACPRNVIAPAHIENGLLGMRSPMLDFEENYCDFCQEENDGHPLCASVCPTWALKLDDDATVSNTLLGLAVLDTTTCLAYRDTGCRFCYDACPYEAIELTDENVNPRPYVIAENCNGCGACESVCASLTEGSISSGATERAIVVRSLDALE